MSCGAIKYTKAGLMLNCFSLAIQNVHVGTEANIVASFVLLVPERGLYEQHLSFVMCSSAVYFSHMSINKLSKI